MIEGVVVRLEVTAGKRNEGHLTIRPSGDVIWLPAGDDTTPSQSFR